jgi:hypothetical protein
MKKKINPLILFGSSVAMLTGCGQPIDSFEQVSLLYGTEIGMDAKIEGESHLTQVAYEEFSSMVEDKKNFIIVSHSTTNFCSCWAAFHENILAPYIKKHRLLVYFVDYQDIVGKDSYGLKVLPNHETIGIYKEGALLYQHNNSDVESDWVTKYDVFSEWMDARLSHPQAFYINKDMLDEKYKGGREFTIYFDRSTCPDCAFLDANGLPAYFNSRKGCDPLFVLDCDVVGIRLLQGEDGKTYGPSNSDSASDYQKQAYAQWSEFKSEYGLAYEESNPAGWDSGYVPTIYHVNPDGAKKKGDVIDASGVFFNDAMDKSGKVTTTYYTAARLEEDYMQYLRESGVAKKTLENIQLDGTLSRREAFKDVHNAILNALLDWCIAN